MTTNQGTAGQGVDQGLGASFGPGARASHQAPAGLDHSASPPRAAFTPPPWEYDGDDDTVISSINGTAIACPYWGTDGVDAAFEQERVANMRLIAAAPDGLELAEDAIPILEALLDERGGPEEDEILACLLERTRAFVAKARGES